MYQRRRFSDALSGVSSSLADQHLIRTTHAIVIPTLGMIIPNWFLIVPHLHSYNIAQQTTDFLNDLPLITAKLLKSVQLNNQDMLLFEHGALKENSPIGCGLDHAHLHVLIASSALIDEIWASIQRSFVAPIEKVSLDTIYKSIKEEQTYYVAWRGGERMLQQPVRQEVSQYFRKIVAKEVNLEDCWSYKQFPFDENIETTWRSFSRCSAATS